MKLNPTGSPLAIQALLNYPPGQSQIDNASAIPLGTGGAVDVGVFQGGGSASLIVDVNGYYAQQLVVSTVNSIAGPVLLLEGTGIGINQLNNMLTLSVPPAGLNADRIAAGQVVKNVNGLFDGVTLAAGSNMSITPAGNTLTFAATVPTSVPGYEIKTQAFDDVIVLHSTANHSLACSSGKKILGAGASTDSSAYLIESVQYFQNGPTSSDAVSVSTFSLCDPNWFAGCNPIPTTTTTIWLTCSN